MRYVILLILIFICYNPCFSQQYPIPADGAVWLDTEFDDISVMGNSFTQQYEPSGDTIINSIQYTKIRRTGWANYYLIGPCSFNIGRGLTNDYKGAIRTDKNEQVYFIYNGDTTENLIYDFSVTTGDSVLMDGFYQQYYAHIENIDSILIGSDYRKRVTLKGIFYLDDQWIEGIGSIYGLFATSDRNWEFTSYELTCFKENNIILYKASDSECDRCNIVTSTDDPYNYLYINIYPNPIIDKSQIVYPEEIRILKLIVYDLTGRIVYSSTAHDLESIFIDRENLSQGVLLLELIDNNHNTYKKKIIVL
jgi:hypothetical protein